MSKRAWLCPWLAVLTIGACQPGSARPMPDASTAGQRPSDQRVLTIGITTVVQSFGLAGASTSAGGWMSATEIHTAGLVTSDVASRKLVGRLASKVPSQDDGSIALLADGGERVIYTLRSGVTWQDGAPFTAEDVLFSYRLDTDPGLPFLNRDALDLVSSVEAPDPLTIVMTFKAPYYLADSLGVRMFWLYPKHLLQDAYEAFGSSGDTEDFLKLPYWTSGYVSTGPFRLTEFSPGDHLTFEAYDGYFLGRPRVDAMRVRSFGSPTVLYSNLLAGSVDVFMDQTLLSTVGFQLADQWKQSGQGTAFLISGYVRMLIPQHRPEFQKEPGNLNLNVRKALYAALDRETLATALQGHPEMAAYAIFPTEDRNFAAVRDGLRVYGYDPARSRATLEQEGWTYRSGGALVNATDGRRFQTSVWVNPGSDQEVAGIADYWRRVGLEVDEQVIPPELTRDNQYRATYPGWATTANYGDGVLARIGLPSGPATRWTGGNQGGYDDPAGRRLVDAYRQSVRVDDQLRAAAALSDYVAANLPFMPFVYQADHIGVRAGIRALDDVDGGAGAGAAYGTYTRNAHLWHAG